MTAIKIPLFVNSTIITIIALFNPNTVYVWLFPAYWWVIVTMTTVGYGDYYPKNIFGYAVAAVVMLLGLMITALPIAIIGANFSIYYEYHRKRLLYKKSSKLSDSQLTPKSEGSKEATDGQELEQLYKQ